MQQRDKTMSTAGLLVIAKKKKKGIILIVHQQENEEIMVKLSMEYFTGTCINLVSTLK